MLPFIKRCGERMKGIEGLGHFVKSAAINAEIMPEQHQQELAYLDRLKPGLAEFCSGSLRSLSQVRK